MKTKRFLTKLGAMLLMLALLLSSCAKQAVDCIGLMEELCALQSGLPGSETVYGSVEKEGYQMLSEQDAAHIYTGSYGALPEWSLLEEYAIRLPDQPQIYEVHVLKVKNPSDAEAVAKVLCKRADLLAEYFKSPKGEGEGEFDYSAYKAEVYTKGQYVFLLATGDNEAAIKLIEKRV